MTSLRLRTPSRSNSGAGQERDREHRQHAVQADDDPAEAPRLHIAKTHPPMPHQGNDKQHDEGYHASKQGFPGIFPAEGEGGQESKAQRGVDDPVWCPQRPRIVHRDEHQQRRIQHAESPR